MLLNIGESIPWFVGFTFGVVGLPCWLDEDLDAAGVYVVACVYG